MTIEEIFSKQTSNDVISELKSRRYIPQPDVESARKALNPELHKVNDPILRPDKRVKVDADNEANSAQKVIDAGGEATNYKTEKVARIKLALQKLIIKRAVSFCFGNPVLYNASPENDNQQLVVKALKRILYDNKTNSLNRKIGRAIFGFKECAELWYPVSTPNANYGFESKFKLRCAVFSPELGDTLYPYWDETGDMIAFSRSFSQKSNDGNAIDYFETYTDTQHWLWVNGANGFEVVAGYPRQISIGKIPVIYGHQDQFETEDVDSLIERLETLLSNFADTNDYHAAPKLFIKGQIVGFSKKGESGAVIEGEGDADMKYVSWQDAPEAVKLEIETLLKMSYTITQTPDISFDSVKGLGAISGVALMLLFMDAHLKVQDKKEVFDDYLQRRVNVIKSYIGKFNTALEKECEMIEIEPEITPYMLTNEIDEINMWLAANGNKPLVSQKQSVKSANLSQDPEADFEQIQEESSRENTFVVGEQTFDA
jgi:SPP1 family phage portal protein